MTIDTLNLDIGDWIVHAHRGVGQVKGIEEKTLGKVDREYFKIRTHNSTYWIPVDRSKTDHIRPVSSSSIVRKAIRILQKKPKKMQKDHRKRRSRIEDTYEDGSLIEIARLLRDIAARRSEKKLTITEEEAMKKLKERFVREWVVATGEDIQEARQELGEILIEHTTSEVSAKLYQ